MLTTFYSNISMYFLKEEFDGIGTGHVRIFFFNFKITILLSKFSLIFHNNFCMLFLIILKQNQKQQLKKVILIYLIL